MEGNNFFPAPVPAGDQKKKGKGWLIAIVIAAAALLLAAGGFLVYKLVFDTPKARLAKGLAGMAGEMSDYGGHIAEELDYATIRDRLYKEPYSVDMRLNITVPDVESVIDTVGFDISEQVDYPGRKLKGDFGISVWNADLFSGSVTVDDDTLYVSMPTLVKDTYSINLGKLGRDYNRSEWAQLLGRHLEEDFSYDIFAIADDTESSQIIAEEYREIILEDWKKAVEAATIENSRTSVEIERDGKTIRCEGIKVVLDEESLNQLLEDVRDGFIDSPFMEEQIAQMMESYDTYGSGVEKQLKDGMEEMLTIEIEEDVEICFYLDSKNRIVSIAVSKGIKINSTWIDEIGFSFVFSGTERTLDEISGTLDLELAKEELKISVERSAMAEKSYYENEVTIMAEAAGAQSAIAFKYQCEWDLQYQEFDYYLGVSDGDEELAVKVKGGFSDVVGGERFTLNLGQVSLLENDEELLKIAGSYSVEPFSGEIKVPDNAINVFGMSETEINGLVLEVLSSLSQIETGL